MITKISKTRAIISLLVVVLLILLVLWALNSYGMLTLSTEEFRDLVERLGVFGPLLIIGFLAIEVVIAPFPGFVAAVASGYSFGYFAGAIYVYIGTIIGSIIAFWLSRIFGQPVIKYFISQTKIEKFNCFFREKGTFLLWIIYLFPILPTDIACFATGLTDFKFKKFLKIITIAYLPYIFLTSVFGSLIDKYGLLSIRTIWLGSIIIACLVIGIIIYLSKIKKDTQCKK